MKVPMREKYVDEVVGIWMVFGKYTDGSGNVEVSSATNDSIFTGGLPPEQAYAVVEAQREFREKLYKILCNFDNPAKKSKIDVSRNESHPFIPRCQAGDGHEWIHVKDSEDEMMSLYRCRHCPATKLV